MAQPILVGVVPQKISGSASKPYLISNDPTSAATIYLGQNSAVSVNNYGIKLTPGSSLTWTEITGEVWAVVGSNTANVTVIYEATGQVSGQTTTLASVYPQLLQTAVIPFNFSTGTGQTVNIQTYDFPVVNTYLTNSWITWANGSTAVSATGTITVRVYGLYNVVVQQERYQNFIGDAQAALEGKLILGTATATNTTGFSTQAQNGAATLMLSPATTGLTALSVVLQTWLAPPTRQAVARLAVTTPGTLNAGNVWNINLPNSPLVLEYNQTGTGTGAFSLMVTRN